MPVYKYVIYAVYCELCDNMEETGIIHRLKEAHAKWKKLGWRRTKKGWVCPNHKRVTTPSAPVEQAESNES